MDHGKILALDTPANLKQSTGADTIVTVKVASDGDKLAERLKREIAGIVSTRVVDNSVTLQVEGSRSFGAAGRERRGSARIEIMTSRWPSRRSRPSLST